MHPHWPLRFPWPHKPPTPVDKVGRLALNFDELKDWNPTWVFTDAMKSGRPWLTQVPGTLSPWDTGATLSTDADGWPILFWGQSAATTLFKDIDGVYPGGVYNVFFDGSGSMEYAHDATLIENVAPGHDRVFVSPTNTGMVVKIAYSDTNDHVRNVRVIMPGFENTYTWQTFHPEFLDRIEPFGALRYMQWQNTNFTTLQHWWERPTATTWSQAGSLGMAVEYMVELANTTKKAPWFCLPHLATDDFVREFARYVAQNLDQDVPAYVEYSNEVWNNQFAAFSHASANGLAEGLGFGTPAGSEQFYAAWKWYSKRSVQVFDIWTQEFQSVPGSPVDQRLVRVLAAQHANPNVGEIICDHNQAYLKADVLAVAPYLGYSFGTPENQWEYVNKPNWQIFDELEVELANDVAPKMAENVQIAQSRGLDLIAYEGGQHLAGVGPAQNNQALTDKFIQINRDPEMYSLYIQLLTAWDNAGAKFMTPYSFCGEFTEFGSWGHLEYLTQPLEQAHKHRALVDWAAGGVQPPPPPSTVDPQVSYYGLACQNLWMGHNGSPTLGSTNFNLTVVNAPAWGSLNLMVSPSNSDFYGVPLPVELTGLGQLGCSLYVGQAALYPDQANASGSLVKDMAIPTNPALAGTKFYVQWSVNMPWFGYLGVGLSNAAEITIGS